MIRTGIAVHAAQEMKTLAGMFVSGLFNFAPHNMLLILMINFMRWVAITDQPFLKQLFFGANHGDAITASQILTVSAVAWIALVRLFLPLPKEWRDF